MLHFRKLSIKGCLPAMCMALLAASCTKLPEDVLDKKEMVSLLVDIHKGESVVDIQRGIYGRDSMKKMVKQSILLKHGITQARLDTSFVYYGHHIEDYLEIYDDVIKKLEEELKASNGNKNRAPVFAEGDSVNVWHLSPMYKLSADDGLRNIVFEIPKDDNWREGDNYLLQFKIINSRQQSPQFKATLYARYDSGRVELRPVSSVVNGWMKVRLVTDSTMLPASVFGAINYDLAAGENVYLDSVSLVRTRNRKETYFERNGQRKLNFPPE